MSKSYIWRVMPKEDLKLAIKKKVQDLGWEAGYVASCIGSLEQARFRLADAKTIIELNYPCELLHVSGTVSIHRSHLHIAISDEKGKVWGGHMIEECIVKATAEVVINKVDNYVLKPQLDTNTGFMELNAEQYD